MHVKEGFIDYCGFKTYYIVYGELTTDKTPLVALHGGPGYPHYHLENLAELAKKGRPVVLYDQLGCGKSDRPDDSKLWTIEHFINELNAVREQLGLTHINLLGHSWGGSLAAEYMLTKPDGVERLILSSPLLDSKLWVAEANRLIGELPAWAAALMRENEAAGTTDTYEYQQAYAEFKSRHICRAKPYPLSLVKADSEFGTQVYQTMWGPSETHATGSLKDWSVVPRLRGIGVPTLFLSGKYDEATPKQIEQARAFMPGSRWVMFEHSAHTANLEEPENYLGVVEKFLSEKD
jgi:proline-specific peptidase